jgi:hypothetical protein
MVQNTIRGFLSWLGAMISGAVVLLPWILVVVGVLAVFGLVFYSLHPRAFARVMFWLRQNIKSGARWSWVLMAILLTFFGLNIAQHAVSLRHASQNSARFSQLEDPPGRDTQQQQPRATYTQEKTYIRSIRVPPEVLKRLDTEGREAILPYVQQYLGEPQSRNVRRVVDSILENGKSLFFVREAQIVEAQKIEMQSSEITVDFEFGDTGLERSFYRANFIGKYTFQNPSDKPLDVVFHFPFPNNSGALTDFKFAAKGETANDIVSSSNGFTWFNRLQAKEIVTVTVMYKNQGSDIWNYQFDGRNTVNQFKLTVNSPRTVKFLRGSLYPTNSGSSLVWKFPKMVTSQGVVLSFPETALRETLNKSFAFMPFAVLLALVWVTIYGWHQAIKVKPEHVALGLLGMGLGLAASAVFMGYTSPSLALWLGAGLAAILGILALGVSFVLPVLVSSFASIAFLSGGNAGLWLLLVGLLMLSSVLPKGSLKQLTKRFKR